MNSSTIKPYSNQPYWHQDTDFQPEKAHPNSLCDPDQLDKHFDIVVVGSGFTGLSAAYTLAKAGKKVAVIDSAEIGGGASSRNGGLLGPSFHKLGLQGLTKKYGMDTANAVLKESLAGFDWLINFIQSEQIDCDLQHCGRFRGALRQSHYSAMCRQAESLAQALNYPVELIDKAQQTEHVGTKKYHGGVLYTKDASLHPAKLVKSLIIKNLDAGAKLLAHHAVTRLQKNNNGFTISVKNQRINADKILIATNGYTSGLTQALKRRILPIRSSMIATQVLSQEIMDSITPKRHTHGGSDRLVFYYRPSPDGTRLLFGGRSIHNEDRPAEYSQYLYQNMLDLFPQLKDHSITNAWSGLVAYSFDHVPHLGVDDGLYYAMGYCGSGVARANFLGHKIALKMLNQGGDSIFDQFDFTSKAFYSGNPWFMPSVLRWHSIADKLGL
jgi:glycine/D-amino acid oxidase-like deaminating enzyme